MIESPREEGVRDTLTSVTVGCGDAIAVGLAGAAEDSPVEEQAVNMSSPINRTPDAFFMADMGNRSNINTHGQPLAFQTFA